jgi:predicted nucleic acid-binding protein
MRAVFADTCYWLSLLNPRDQTHDIAIRVSKGLTGDRIVTTEEVLTEVLNYFGSRGPYFRSAAAKLVERMQADRSIDILPQTHNDFLAGLGLYQAQTDKGYSLTDCISMSPVFSDFGSCRGRHAGQTALARTGSQGASTHQHAQNPSAQSAAALCAVGLAWRYVSTTQRLRLFEADVTDWVISGGWLR